MSKLHQMLRVKPAKEGEIVRVPERKMRPLDPKGEIVPGNDYWHRRLAMGDVVEVADEKPQPREEAAPAVAAENAEEAPSSDAPPRKKS